MLPSYLVDPSDSGYDSYHREYITWMSNPANVFKCGDCPERKDHSSCSELPCSQQYCWVEVTCFPERFHF